MLPRVLEPEAMDDPVEAAAYDAMDHAQVNEAFVRDLCAFAPDVSGWAIDLGAGTLQIPILLARAAPCLRILGVDLARAMLARGRQNLAHAGLERSGAGVSGGIADAMAAPVVPLLCDGKRLPLASECVDAVISNSIVHHLAEPDRMFAEAVRICRPGGRFFMRDLLRPADEATLAQLVARYAGGAPAEARQLFAQSLHAALTLDEVRGIVADRGFAVAGVRQTSDRHWTWAAEAIG